MYKIAVMVVICALAAGPVAASDRTDVMAVIHQWVDAFNRGDRKAALATCTDQGAIIDDIAPHEWYGPGMCSRWWSFAMAWNSKNGITEANVTPGEARHIDIDGSHAYVVLPTTFTYKDHGRPVKQTGSVAIICLLKGNSGWRISGWAWADGLTVSNASAASPVENAADSRSSR